MLKKALAMMVVTSAFASAPKFHQERIVIKLKEGASLPSHQLIKSSQNLFNNTYIVRTQSPKELAMALKDSNSIAHIQFDYFSGRDKLPRPLNSEKLEKNLEKRNGALFNDPGLRKLWAFKPSANGGMSVTEAYENFGSASGDPVIVAVVDTGVDYNHEDLKDVMWVNEGEIPGNGIDDDGNGYIDDIHGINTLNRDSEGRATGEIMDKHSHGTHVSGTIGATQDNGIGISGVASNVKIMGIRTVPNSGDETDVDVAESFIYAAKMGAKIINCSFGKRHNEGGMLVRDTIEHIGKEYGVLVVAAAGNESSNNDRSAKYPASFDNDNLMVVASTSKWKGLSYFSNYGLETVDIAAPGSGIYSTTPGNRYSNMSGTSMASPNMAGVAAEVLARNPHLGPVELKTRLMENVTKVSKYSSKMVSGGLANLNESLK